MLKSKRLFLISLITILISMAMLISVTFAWFTSTTSTKVPSVKSPTYTLSYQIDNNLTSTSEPNTYTMNSNSCNILLTATGTENASGYYVVNIKNTNDINGTDYYTQQIVINSNVNNNKYTITIDNTIGNASAGTTISLTSKWGKLPSTTNNITITPYNNNGNGISVTSLQGQEPAVEEQQESTKDEQTVEQTQTGVTTTPVQEQISTEEAKTGTQDTETNKTATTTDTGNDNSETIGETVKTNSSTDKAEVNDNNSGTDIVDNADELGNIGE